MVIIVVAATLTMVLAGQGQADVGPVAPPPPETGMVSCGDAVSALIPCGAYLMGAGAEWQLLPRRAGSALDGQHPAARRAVCSAGASSSSARLCRAPLRPNRCVLLLSCKFGHVIT